MADYLPRDRSRRSSSHASGTKKKQSQQNLTERFRFNRRMLGAASATDAADAEKTPFVPAEEKHGAEADAENYPIRRLSFTAALTPRSRATVQQDRARRLVLHSCVFAGLVLLLVLGISRAAME